MSAPTRFRPESCTLKGCRPSHQSLGAWRKIEELNPRLLHLRPCFQDRFATAGGNLPKRKVSGSNARGFDPGLRLATAPLATRATFQRTAARGRTWTCPLGGGRGHPFHHGGLRADGRTRTGRVVLTMDVRPQGHLIGSASTGGFEPPTSAFGGRRPRSAGPRRESTHGRIRTCGYNVRSVAPLIHLATCVCRERLGGLHLGLSPTTVVAFSSATWEN